MNKHKKSRPLTSLEIAIARNNAIEILADAALIATLEKGDVQTIADTWFQEFTNVHRRLYESRMFNHDDERPGNIWKSKGRVVAPVLATLVKQLYDEVGFAKMPHRAELASFLADAYTTIFHEEPFEYGGVLAIRTFFALIGKTQALTDSLGAKLDIDFTRLGKEDFATLESQEPSENEAYHKSIDEVFLKLLDPAHNRPTSPLEFAQKWESLPKSDEEIAQKHFLSHWHGHATCLVTINGGLVPLDAIEGKLIQHLNRGGHQADFTVSKEKIVAYLIEDGRKDLPAIDGVPVTELRVPLVPLNIDLLTGLDVTTQLPSVKQYCKHHGTHLLRLPEYVKGHELPDNLKNRLTRAAERIEQTRVVVWESINQAFAGKTPVPSNQSLHFFMTMGGTGSGKSALADIARSRTDGNLVIASLDDARLRFKTYELYSSVGRDLSGSSSAVTNHKAGRLGHHFGDYISLETAAGLIRDGILERAKGAQGDFERMPLSEFRADQRYHVLYDGSGVPYKGRYDKLVFEINERKKKKPGDTQEFSRFEATVLAADAPLSTAYKRACTRLTGTDGRAVPPKVIVDKHRGMPRAVWDAAQDEQVQRFEILDTTKDEYGKHYVLAFRVSIHLEKVKELEDARREITLDHPNALYEALLKNGLVPDSMDHAPVGWQNRTEFIVVAHEHHERISKVLVILDSDRMRMLMEKGAINPVASGLTELYLRRYSFEQRERPTESESAASEHGDRPAEDDLLSVRNSGDGASGSTGIDGSAPDTESMGGDG